MRIAHVVTHISPDNAFGGPVRVAINQLRELQRNGHQVALYAGYQRFPERPVEYEGIPVRAFPARRLIPGTGYAGLWSPGMALSAALTREQFDVVHVHLARDLVTLPMALLSIGRRWPLVVQTHGMIDPSTHPLARPLDALATKRIFGRAGRILYLTDWERKALESVGADPEKLVRLVNGVPLPEKRNSDRPGSLNVVFVGRLQEVKRPRAFVEAATMLLTRFPDVTFSLVGADEGEAHHVEKMIHDQGGHSRIRWEGSIPAAQVDHRLSESGVFVLASAHDTFPMAVLEAAALGLPSVVTDGCGLASDLASYQAGIVSSTSASGLAEGLARLLESSELRAAMGGNARRMVQEEFSIEVVVGRLASIYDDVVSAASGRKLVRSGS